VSDAPETSTIDNTAAEADALAVGASEITALVSDLADTNASEVNTVEVDDADATALEAEAKAFMWDMPSKTIIDEIIPSLLAKIGATVVVERRDPMANPSELAQWELDLVKAKAGEEVVKARAVEDFPSEIMHVVVYNKSDKDAPLTDEQIMDATRLQGRGDLVAVPYEA